MSDIVIKFKNCRYERDEDIKNLIMYIAGKGSNEFREKVLSQGTRGLSRDPETAAAQLIRTQERINKNKKCRMLHLIISFDKEQKNTDVITAYADEVATLFGKHMQLLYAVHSSTDNIHIHYALSRVSAVNGYKLRISKSDFCRIKWYLKQIAEKRYYLNYTETDSLVDFIRNDI